MASAGIRSNFSIIFSCPSFFHAGMFPLSLFLFSMGIPPYASTCIPQLSDL